MPSKYAKVLSRDTNLSDFPRPSQSHDKCNWIPDTSYSRHLLFPEEALAGGAVHVAPAAVVTDSKHVAVRPSAVRLVVHVLLRLFQVLL